MRTYIGHHEVVTGAEFDELAYGIDRDLFLGTPGETPTERAARLDAARDILDDLREQATRDEVAAVDALYAEQLARTVPLMRRAVRSQRNVRRTGDAA